MQTAGALREIRIESKQSPLGSWTTARWSPPNPSPLRGVVERIWYFDGVMTHPRERVFPDGRAELIVMLDEPHRDGDADSLPAFPAVCINGLRTRSSVVVAPGGRCRVLGIAFEPVGACMLLRSSVKELVDVTIDLTDALGRAAAELGERCATAAAISSWNPARNAAAALVAALQWTTQLVTRRAAIGDPAIDETAHLIRNASGVVSVDAIGSIFAIPRPQLAQRFRDRVGVTPKRFARIVRFHAALARLSRSRNIAAAAAELAYYDQAHMYRDFAEFAGMTPGAFVAATRYEGSASLAES
jgi:AraC-like DNA-binding protein